jgi:hypothetical protein
MAYLSYTFKFDQNGRKLYLGSMPPGAIANMQATRTTNVYRACLALFPYALLGAPTKINDLDELGHLQRADLNKQTWSKHVRMDRKIGKNVSNGPAQTDCEGGPTHSRRICGREIRSGG